TGHGLRATDCGLRTGNGSIRCGGRVGAARLGAALHDAALAVHDDDGGVAVADLALAADFLEAVTARGEILEHAAGEAIFDQDARRAGVSRIAADQEARPF